MTAACSTQGCERPARAGVRTTRPSRGDMRVTLYADDRTAPKTASLHCHAHTVEMMTELSRVLVDGDDDEAAA